MSPNANALMRQIPVSSDNIKYLALRSGSRQLVAGQRSRASWSVLLLVIAAHVGVFYWLQGHTVALPKEELAKPMLVSLIPAPRPEVIPTVPVIPKPVVHKVQLKVEKVVPPLPRPIADEPAVQPPLPLVETKVVSKDTPPVEQPPAVESKAEPKIEKVEEPKIEPPLFGVATLNNPDPPYPRISKSLGEHGLVILHVLVSAEGAAQTVDLQTSSGFDRLDQAAIETVQKKWRFIAAKRNGEAVSAYVNIPFKFAVKN
jgi:protein TonB